MPHLLMFGKKPRLGCVKTRLVPPLSPEQALRLYRAFLDDQLAFLAGFANQADVAWWTDEPLEPTEHAALSSEGLDLCLQAPGDLGARMFHALEQTCRGPSGPAVIVGADCPTLPAARVSEAFAILERGAPAVIAPADDGGYVLVGMHEPRRELFEDVAWGGADVAATTRRRAAAIGLELVELAPWYDVDEMDSLRRLRDELAGPEGAKRAPATARTLLDLELPGVL
jgi:rSAM/selenodomain-associated transferase 1